MRHLIKPLLPMQIHVKFPLFRDGTTTVLEPNLNDTQWLSTDKLRLIRVISPLCLPGLGTGINAAVIITDLLLARPNDYCLNAKLRTQALSKHVLSLVGK